MYPDMGSETDRTHGMRTNPAKGGKTKNPACGLSRVVCFPLQSFLSCRHAKEIHLFAERTHRMFGMVQDLMHTEKDDDFNKLFSRVEKVREHQRQHGT